MPDFCMRLVVRRAGRRDELLWIYLRNPEARNALDETMQVELLEQLKLAAADAAIRCVILRGDGDSAFCSGGDIKIFDGMTPLRGEWYSTHRGWATHQAITGMPKPVIAAVDGWCLAGGCEVALMCDFAYATRSARFGLPEINLGVSPGWGGTVRLQQAIGQRRAKELILRGEIISAEDAHSLGLINKLFDTSADLYREIEVVAQEIADKSSLAVRVAKQVMNDSAHARDEVAFSLERGANVLLVASPDSKEGVSAFLEKRKPHFS